MTDSWPRRPFAELYAEPSRNGMTVPKAERGTGTPMVNMRELFAHDFISDQGTELVPVPSDALMKWGLQDGDLLFGRRSLTLAGAGKCSIVVTPSRPLVFESSLIRVRLDIDRACPRFFFYLFKSHSGRALIETIVEQVAVAGIRSSDLARLIVPVPPLEQQRRVAAVLGALDDLVHANHRISISLEQLLATKFAMAGFDRPRNGSHRLDELISIDPRYPKPRTDAPYIDMAALPTDHARVATVARRAATGGARFRNGDTLLARITPCLENGKTAYIDQLGPEEIGIGSTEFIVLRSEGVLGHHWSYFLARSPRFREYAIQHMTGTSGRQRCPADAIERYPIATPDYAESLAFAKLAEVLFDAIRALDDEAKRAAYTRDELLPLLLSGQLQVDQVAA